MSCNGCRILRKGCNENCILRQSLQGIESPQAQANAAVFVAKFFGRAGLMSFLSSVPQSQRPAMLQSLLYEACGRTINPVNGAVGLLSTGNWHLCQAAVDTVFRGGVIAPMTEANIPFPPMEEEHDDSEASNLHLSMPMSDHHQHPQQGINVMSRFPAKIMTFRGKAKRWAESPEEEQSGTTTSGSESCLEYNCQNLTGAAAGHETPVLRFFL